MDRQNRILKLLTEYYTPEFIKLVDESHKHSGHNGHDGSPGTHFRLTLVSDSFVDKGRIDRQREVYGLLSNEFDTGLHALALQLYTPKDYKNLNNTTKM